MENNDHDHHDHPDPNEDHPLIPPIEPTPMTITLVMADSNRDPPRLPPPPGWNSNNPANSTTRPTTQPAMPTGAQAVSMPWAMPANSDEFSPKLVPTVAGNSRTQPNMTNQGRQQTIVIIAVDMSDQSDYAFDHYVRHLHRPDNRIILVHSISSPHIEVQMPSSGSGAPISYVETSHDHLRDLLQKKQDHISRVRQHFEQKIRALPNQLHYSFHFTNHASTAGEAIVDVITRFQPSFAVLGSRGLGAYKRNTLSTVGHYVMNHTNTPVMICHKGDNTA